MPRGQGKLGAMYRPVLKSTNKYEGIRFFYPLHYHRIFCDQLHIKERIPHFAPVYMELSQTAELSFCMYANSVMSLCVK